MSGELTAAINEQEEQEVCTCKPVNNAFVECVPSIGAQLLHYS